MPDDLIKIGYGHASMINCMRPDIAYPDRKIRTASRVYTEILKDPCPCPDEHVEVWVRPVKKMKKLYRNPR